MLFFTFCFIGFSPFGDCFRKYFIMESPSTTRKLFTNAFFLVPPVYELLYYVSYHHHPLFMGLVIFQALFHIIINRSTALSNVIFHL